MDKPIEFMTPEELKEYYEEKTALDRMEEKKLKELEELEEDEEYEPEYYGDEDLD